MLPAESYRPFKIARESCREGDLCVCVAEKEHRDNCLEQLSVCF